MLNRVRKVAIISHNGRSNLGDEAIVESLVAGLESRVPGLELVCFSMHPADTEQRIVAACHAVRFDAAGPHLSDPSARISQLARIGSADSPATPAVRRPAWVAAIRRTLRWIPSSAAFVSTLPARWRYIANCQRLLRGTDLLIVAGSNQILDQFGGTWGFPYTLLRWTLQARMAGARTAFVSVGAGPLIGGLSKWMIRRAICRADYVSLRDSQSIDLLRPMLPARVANAIVKMPDLAFDHPELQRVEAAPGEYREPRQHAIIAINVMPVNDPRYWPDADPAAYARYVECFARLADSLVTRGHRVKFFTTQNADARVAQDVFARLSGTMSPYLDHPRTTAELLCCISAADVVVASRLHGIVMSIACGRPVIGICYHPKAQELMVDAGLGERAFPLESVTQEHCLEAIEHALAHHLEIAETVRTYTSRQAVRLQAQLDCLTELTTQASVATTELHVGSASRFENRGPFDPPDPERTLEPQLGLVQREEHPQAR